MKTIEEIRAYRDSLRFGAALPCRCRPGFDHEAECYSGRLMMDDAINTLSWVLDDLSVDVAILFNLRVERCKVAAAKGAAS